MRPSRMTNVSTPTSTCALVDCAFQWSKACSPSTTFNGNESEHRAADPRAPWPMHEPCRDLSKRRVRRAKRRLQHSFAASRLRYRFACGVRDDPRALQLSSASSLLRCASDRLYGRINLADKNRTTRQLPGLWLHHEFRKSHD